MAVVYFTSNASTGAGSLVEAIRNAQPGDVVRPDETVFERGSTIEIVLASTLTVAKNLTLDAAPCRVRLVGGGATGLTSARGGAVVEVSGFDFVGGVNSSTYYHGGGATISENSTAVFNRCLFAGCETSRSGGAIFVQAGSNAEVRDSVIVGCRAASTAGGLCASGSATVSGSTIIGNVDSTGVNDVGGSGKAAFVNSIIGASAAKTSSESVGSVVGVASSTVGFVASPPDDLTPENWNANLWQDWDLRLFDDASLNPSPHRDSGDVGEMSQYDLQGNFRGRETGGVATCSPGAYETIQADLFWIGRDATGAEIVSPSFLTSNGWAASRFATVSGDVAPQVEQKLFVDGAVVFDDVLTTANANGQRFALTLGGGANVRFPSGAVHLFDLQTGAASTFTFSSVRPSEARFGDCSRLVGTFSALPKYNVGSQVYIQAAQIYSFAQPEATYGVLTVYAQKSTALQLDGAYRCDGFRIYAGAAASDVCAITTPGTTVCARVVNWGSASSTVAERLVSEPITLILQEAASLTLPDAAPESWADAFDVDVSEATSATLTLNGQTFYGDAPTCAVSLTGSAKIDERGLDVASLTLNADATLTIDGGKSRVATLNVVDGANVEFSGVDAVLTATESATVGAATFTGAGYFATPAGTDASAATFAEAVRVVDYSAGVADFTATATGPKTAKLEWSATDATRTVCIERESVTAPNGWEVVAVATAAESPLSVALSGRERFRVFDGATFTVDSAWFPTGDFYVYVADDISAVAAVAVEWETATQLISAGNVMYRNENVLLLASVKNKLTADYLNRDEVESATATVYAVSPGFGAREIWTPVDGWADVAVPLDAILEAPTEIDGWTLDAVGPNFVWTPDATERPLFGDSGTFAVQVCVKRKSGGNPIYFTFRAVVK